jgi:endonuclease/exonuclease/phosphatase family metal-dependent hydrolase
VAEEAARKLGYRVSFVACDPRIRDQGLAILSPYEIADVQFIKLKTCELHFNCRTRFALSATVQAPFGNVRAWNVHLDTRINPKERIEQLQPVIDEAARQPGPRLIGGDFNTNGLYWFGNLLPVPCGAAHSIAIRKTMRQRGFETPFPDGLNTFRALHRHLDWIFLSGMEPLEAGVEPTQFSDHNAIWVRARS